MMNTARLKYFTVTGGVGGTPPQGGLTLIRGRRQTADGSKRAAPGYPTRRTLSALMVTITRTWSRPPYHGYGAPR